MLSIFYYSSEHCEKTRFLNTFDGITKNMIAITATSLSKAYMIQDLKYKTGPIHDNIKSLISKQVGMFSVMESNDF